MKYTHLGRLFYIDAEVPSDVKEMDLTAGEHTVKARKLLWRFWWVK